MTPEEQKWVDCLNGMVQEQDVTRVREYVKGADGTTMLFAIRYFNESNEELAYFIPHLQPEGALVVFEPPRIWSSYQLSKIGIEA